MAPLPVILHVDMDAFFASVELRTRPELRGKPVVVAGQGRSVVVAATYEARAFGVHAAMNVARARALCPQAVFLPPSKGEYSRVSRRVMAILGGITPLVEQVSIDEAFLDVTGALKRLGTPRDIGQLIRSQVATQEGITCSVGVAGSKSVAKIASTRAKPDGLLEVPPDQTVEFLTGLDIDALWGVGAKTAESLRRLGLLTVGDLAASPDNVIVKAVGDAVGHHLLALARGQDEDPVRTFRREKSLGVESTFEHDLPPGEPLRQALMRLVESATFKLRQRDLAARTVAVKLRRSDFTTVTRSRTLIQPTDSAKLVLAEAQRLVLGIDTRALGVRLLGVRLENLAPKAELGLQLSFDQGESVNEDLQQASDSVKRRFGVTAVGPGTLLSEGNSHTKPVRDRRLNGGKQSVGRFRNGGDGRAPI